MLLCELSMPCCAPALVSDTYVPHFLKVNLQEFGADLVAGRDVVGDFVDSQVLIDPLLCTLVLDNAIAQAFQTGGAKVARLGCVDRETAGNPHPPPLGP